MRACVVADREHAGLSDAPSPLVEALLADPRALHDLVIAHLNDMWETFVAPEWAATERSCSGQVDLLSRSSAEAGIALAAIAENLDRYIGDEAARATGVRELVYVPSAHTGRYVQLAWGQVMYLFFDAELHIERVAARFTDQAARAACPARRARRAGSPARIEAAGAARRADAAAVDGTAGNRASPTYRAISNHWAALCANSAAKTAANTTGYCPPSSTRRFER